MMLLQLIIMMMIVDDDYDDDVLDDTEGLNVVIIIVSFHSLSVPGLVSLHLFDFVLIALAPTIDP